MLNSIHEQYKGGNGAAHLQDCLSGEEDGGVADALACRGADHPRAALDVLRSELRPDRECQSPIRSSFEKCSGVARGPFA